MDALGHVSTSVYDPLRRHTVQINPLGAYATFGFDAVGNQIAHVNPLGYITTSTFDGRNQQTAHQDPLGRGCRRERMRWGGLPPTSSMASGR